jgi:hypothetical protein
VFENLLAKVHGVHGYVLPGGAPSGAAPMTLDGHSQRPAPKRPLGLVSYGLLLSLVLFRWVASPP